MALLSSTTTGSGPDLVLLHGWGMHSGVWEAILPRLAQGCRVTCIDLPGHGSSPACDDNSLSSWVDALLQAAPDAAIWLGWSLGGMLATAAAHERAERFKGVITIASNLRFVADSGWPEAMPAERLQAVADDLALNPAATLRRFIALQFLGSGMGRDALRRIQNAVSDAVPGEAGLRAGLELLERLDNRRRAAELQVPLMMLFGQNDRLVPVAAVAAIRSLLPQVETKVIDGAGHAPFLSHPRQFFDAVLPGAKCHAG